MKIILILMTLCFSTMSFASNCTTDKSFASGEWKVSYPENFEEIYTQIKSEIANGLKDGRIVEDLDGTIYTDQSKTKDRIYMRTKSWDNLQTPTSEMHGDMAIFTNRFAPEEVLEVRWYENGVKNIAVNAMYLECVSIHRPMAVNVIF